MEKPFFICTKIIIKNKKNEILVLKRNNNSLDLPGGSLRYNEGPMKCAERELFEETGLKFPNLSFKKIFVANLNDSELPCLFIIYIDKKIRSKIRLNKEHTAYEWLNYNYILSLVKCGWIKDAVK